MFYGKLLPNSNFTGGSIQNNIMYLDVRNIPNLCQNILFRVGEPGGSIPVGPLPTFQSS